MMKNDNLYLTSLMIAFKCYLTKRNKDAQMIFKHTSKEKGMWRGWTKSGDSLEVTWPRTSVGVRFSLSDRENVGSLKQLWVGLGFIQAFIPLGVSNKEFPAMDGPQWGFDFSREFGMIFRWGMTYKSYSWPFHVFTYSYEFLAVDGSWYKVLSRDQKPEPQQEVHAYAYQLQNGTIQERVATVSQRRHVLARHILHKLGLPKRIKNSIDVHFNGEVGERTGSWKGGCIGCSYNLRDSETPLQSLRRMERERKF
jgi:hypothetical protein